MALPYYMPSVGTRTSTSAVPTTKYYQNAAVSIPFVQQFQRKQNMHTLPYQHIQEMFNPPNHGYANINIPSRHYIPRYPSVPPNVFGAQPSLAYQGITMPMSHMPNMIYPNAPPEYSRRSEPVHSYLSQLKSAADRVAASDARVIPDSTTAPEATARPVDNTEVIVIPDDTPFPESNCTKPALDVRAKAGYDLSLGNDPSLGQQFALGERYQPGPGQLYISKIRALVEGIPFDDPRFYISYNKKPKSRAKSTPQLQDNQGEPPAPTERKKRRNTRKTSTTVSASTKAGKPRSKGKSVTQSPDNEPSTSSESKKQKSCECDLKMFSKNPRSDWYPRPVSTNCEYLYIGPNGTFLPTSVYTTISWESVEESTRILMEFIFDDGSLATHSLDGDYRLEPNIVQDVITHVAEKCSVNEETVRSAIFMICADASLRSLGFS